MRDQNLEHKIETMQMQRESRSQPKFSSKMSLCKISRNFLMVSGLWLCHILLLQRISNFGSNIYLGHIAKIVSY